MSGADGLDAAFEIFQARLGSSRHLGVSTDEPLTSDNPPGVGAGLRALTILVRGSPFALLGVTEPTVDVSKPGLLEYLARRARARGIEYLLVTNLQEAWLLSTPGSGEDVPAPHKRYASIYEFSSPPSASLSEAERISLAQRADAIAADVAALAREGALGLVTPDADFFVERVTRAVDVLKPAVKRALRTKLSVNRRYAKELSEWAVRQGIPADLRSDDFLEAVVRQAIYRLLGKIIFYQSLSRVVQDLPAMELSGVDTGQVIPRLQECFEAAHRVDYHAVFVEDIVDRLPFPADASAELRDLVGDLNTRDFAHLPQDVIGAVFEELIPPRDRQALGQYFTPEHLVDLMLAFCVRNDQDIVLDPTCGTGTFLIRAYDRLRTRLAVHDHSRLLSQLWGVDIAPFPAELATINLFRQRLAEPKNFPRILNEDFFSISPGGTYRFPPLKAPGKAGGEQNGPRVPDEQWVDEPVPAFDAIVGNFPYIGADRIERTVKGYRDLISRRLVDDWFEDYAEGFTFKRKSDAKEHRLAREKGLDLAPLAEKAEPIVSTYADLYVYLFWHAATFLTEGGRMGIVTSNAWLDVGYGYALQRFLLDHFKIIAILESRCEPWFLQAAVNTVVTIVERCSGASERDAHCARFVKVKQPLRELIPWDMNLDVLNRWIGLGDLATGIESVSKVSHDTREPEVNNGEHFRVRSVQQGALRAKVEAAGQTQKWGPYLRAPPVYFELLREGDDRLALLRDVAPPARGSLTGNNTFYHFDDAKLAQWHIEPEFLFPLLKCAGESNRILIDPDELALRVFVCRLTKDALRTQGKVNALEYIEWGEKQVFTSGRQAGLTWPRGAEVRNRRPGWYALPEYRSRAAQVFLAKGYGDRHLQCFSPDMLIADCRLYFLRPKRGIRAEEMAAIMNCSLVALLTEVTGRVTLGDGLLEMAVEDSREYLVVPDPRRFRREDREAIVAAFQPILARPIGPVADEVLQADRQALDTAVLRAMGLDPALWLPSIYDGLLELVSERVQLGQMRSRARRNRVPRAADRVREQVLEDILPNGPKCFPNDFLSQAARAGGFREIELPDSPFCHERPSFSRVDLVSEDGQTVTVETPFEARYLRYAQAAGHRVARLPSVQVEVGRAVNNYQRYLRELRQRLYEAYFKRTLDQALAERLVKELSTKYNLPDVMD